MTPEEQKLMDESFTHVDLESKDLVAERVEQLKALFPEIAVEGDGSIDFEKLRLILGDEVDEGQERYAFTWPGKADAIRQAQTPSTATLRPDEKDSVDWDTTENLYIEGDNLEVLKLLQRGYHGKVKMIYIDPPYNTGHDFVYKDSFQDSIENYQEQAGLSGQSNADTSGRYHSDWLSMMYPRLRLARELLTDDGVVFVSIDDSEAKNLRHLLDEVFGESNFIADVIWKHTQQSKNDERYFSRQYNYTLCYCRAKDKLKPFSFERTEQDNINYSNPDNDPKGAWRSGDVRSPNPRPTLCYQIQAPDGTLIDPPANGWRWSKDTVEEKIATGEIKFKNDNSGIIRKIYLSDQEGRTPENLWSGQEFGTTRNAAQEIKDLFDGIQIFDTPKPRELIQKMLELQSMQDGIMLDFFSGSASSAHGLLVYNVLHRAKNHFIAIQLPEATLPDSHAYKYGFHNIAEIGKERIRRAGQKIKAEIEEENKQLKFGEEPKPIPDLGFRVLKLDSSNFDEVPDGTLVDNLIKPGRTHDDIIFEMMLKWGLELSLPMEKTEVAGYPITSIAADELICCMDEGLTVEVLEAIAALEPKRVFFLDSVLTDTIKLNAAQIFKRVGDKLGYEIELRTA